MKIVSTTAALAIALIGTASIPANAHAQVTAHACFIRPIGPFKARYGPIGPIGFGFQVHCTSDPDLRAVTVKLWRKDVHTGQEEMQSQHTDHGTLANDEKIYYTSCFSTAHMWEYHTEAIATAVFNYSGDRDDGNSDSALLDC